MSESEISEIVRLSTRYCVRLSKYEIVRLSEIV